MLWPQFTAVHLENSNLFLAGDLNCGLSYLITVSLCVVKGSNEKLDSIDTKTIFLSLLFQFHRTYVCWVAFSLFVTTKMTLSRSNIVMIGKKWFVNLGEKWRTLTTPRLPELPMFCANLKTAPSVSKLWETKNVWSLCFGSTILLSKK